MTYTFKLPLKLFVFFLFGAGTLAWVILVLLFTAFQPGGGPISDNIKLYLVLPSYPIAFILLRHYYLKNRYKVVLEASTFHMIYDKRCKKSDVHVNAHDIQVLEIIYMANETEYDCCRIYSTSHEVVTLVNSVVPLDDLLNFCKQNDIEPLIFTISLNVFFISLKRKHLTIQYYGRERKDRKIEPGNISRIDLEILHPISDSRNRYVIYTLTNDQYEYEYEFEYHAVDSKKLAAYAIKHNFPLKEKKMY